MPRGTALGGSGHNGLHKLVDKRFTKRNGKPGAHVRKVGERESAEQSRRHGQKERKEKYKKKSIAVELLSLSLSLSFDIYSDCGRLKMPQVPPISPGKFPLSHRKRARGMNFFIDSYYSSI